MNLQDPAPHSYHASMSELTVTMHGDSSQVELEDEFSLDDIMGDDSGSDKAEL